MDFKTTKIHEILFRGLIWTYCRRRRKVEDLTETSKVRFVGTIKFMGSGHEVLKAPLDFEFIWTRASLIYFKELGGWTYFRIKLSVRTRANFGGLSWSISLVSLFLSGTQTISSVNRISRGKAISLSSLLTQSGRNFDSSLAPKKVAHAAQMTTCNFGVIGSPRSPRPSIEIRRNGNAIRRPQFTRFSRGDLSISPGKLTLTANEHWQENIHLFDSWKAWSLFASFGIRPCGPRERPRAHRHPHYSLLLIISGLSFSVGAIHQWRTIPWCLVCELSDQEVATGNPSFFVSPKKSVVCNLKSVIEIS